MDVANAYYIATSGQPHGVLSANQRPISRTALEKESDICSVAGVPYMPERAVTSRTGTRSTLLAAIRSGFGSQANVALKIRIWIRSHLPHKPAIGGIPHEKIRAALRCATRSSCIELYVRKPATAHCIRIKRQFALGDQKQVDDRHRNHRLKKAAGNEPRARPEEGGS